MNGLNGNLPPILSIASGSQESDALTAHELTRQMDAALAHGREQCRKLTLELHAMQARETERVAAAERMTRETFQRREKALRAEAVAVQERYTNLVRDTSESIKQLERALAESKSRCEASQAREQRLSAELAPLRERIEPLQREIEELRRAHTTLEAEARTRIEGARSREERLGSEIRDQREQLARAQAQVTQAQETIARHVAEIELYKGSWTRVLQMERQARVHLENKAKLEGRLQQLEERSGAISSEARERLRDLQAQLTQTRTEADALRRAAEVAERAHEAERSRLEQAVEKERANAACALQAAEEVRNRAAAVVVPPPPPAAARAVAAVEVIEMPDLSEHFEQISAGRQKLEHERETLKGQLAQAASQLKELKSRYPLKDLLAHKEGELTRAVRELKKIDKAAPARKRAEDLVETLAEQREQLRALVRQSDAGA